MPYSCAVDSAPNIAQYLLELVQERPFQCFGGETSIHPKNNQFIQSHSNHLEYKCPLDWEVKGVISLNINQGSVRFSPPMQHLPQEFYWFALAVYRLMHRGRYLLNLNLRFVQINKQIGRMPQFYRENTTLFLLYALEFRLSSLNGV